MDNPTIDIAYTHAIHWNYAHRVNAQQRHAHTKQSARAHAQQTCKRMSSISARLKCTTKSQALRRRHTYHITCYAFRCARFSATDLKGKGTAVLQQCNDSTYAAEEQ
jgi:hypothetical protein